MFKAKTMKIHFVESEKKGNHIDITISDSNWVTVFGETYAYGYNASHCRAYARYAEQDYENAIRFHWATTPTLKPYIGDIINDLIKKYKITSDIIYTGYHLDTREKFTDIELADAIDSLYKEI